MIRNLVKEKVAVFWPGGRCICCLTLFAVALEKTIGHSARLQVGCKAAVGLGAVA